jgi:aryl-alcohol dehydrogenase-like predicted oxidoreductase
MSSLINKIGIGTVQFGLNYGISNSSGKTPENEVGRILNYAKEKGIVYLDTGHAYGNAELVIGKNNLENFRIVSKYVSNIEQGIEEQIELSLKKLNQQSIYAYLAHRPLDLIENNYDSWKKLQFYKNNYKVYKIGASFNSIDEIEKVLDSGIELDIIQVPYNFLDSRFENYMIQLHENGCEVHTRSTFLQGLFFCNIDNLSDFFQEVKPILQDVQQIENLPVQLLQYVLEKEFVDVVNIGVNNLDQLVDNIELIGKTESKLVKLNNQIKMEILMPSSWPK